ncbi:cellobiose phosphorylase, partial [Paenibacillus riograndensis]
YQTVLGLSNVAEHVDAAWSGELLTLAEGIKGDFNRYMLGTDVIPGFLYFEDPADAKLLLHPEDKETGIQYRLLPMTRSMIGELLTPEQMEEHYKLIQEQFLCPDGVRLMNHPAQYAGGVSLHFKRAEQAANFGREIGLQYVHAHIRFVEAMAKTGKRDQVWKGLAVINPIGIRDAVPNAELRQSNAYFSSSDGKFANRYEAQERFAGLRDGSVPVKGGWRIYSSGPGIYMNQLISNVLGIREDGGDLIIDPVLPDELDGTRLDFDYAGAPAAFVYHCSQGVLSHVKVNGQEVQAERLNNPYRLSGLRIKRAEFDRLRRAGGTVVDNYM